MSNKTDADAVFEQKLQYEFKDKSLLDTALTHPSSMSDYNYERLEFLGDAVIELIISDFLYTNYSKFSEGMLTHKRSEIVCSKSLAEIARSVNLGAVLRLGKGEAQTGGRNKTSILENAIEAIMGAVYIDGGYHSAKDVVYKLFYNTIERIMQTNIESDYKSQLQELVQKNFKKNVGYIVKHKEGPPHELTFYVDLIIEGKVICEGIGLSKKAAEQNAAKFALTHFDNIIK